MRMFFATVAVALLSGAIASAADAKAGQAAYDKSCKSCHGADGTPNPGIVKMMKVDMKNLKDASVQGMSAADMKKIITDGKGKMKAISGAPADDIVAYVKSMK